jgi:hypothetical protein
MKGYIKKLLREGLLSEMEIGNTLFGKAPSGRGLGNGNPPQWEWQDHEDWPGQQSFIKKIKQSMGKYVDEVNTDEEYKFLKFIEIWLEDPNEALLDLPSSIFSDFKFLLGVKNKYPLMLDPKKSIAAVDKFVYRGTTIPKTLAIEIAKNGKLSDRKKHNNYWLLYLIETTTPIKSRSLKSKKATSFSLSFDIAFSFYIDYKATASDDDSLVPCILQLPIDSPNLLFNPDFLNILTDHNERETMYVSDSDVKISGIWFPPQILNHIHK